MTLLSNLELNISAISPDLRDIAQKVQSGIRLSKQDGIRLFESTDLLSIGEMADYARKFRLLNSGHNDKLDYVYWINNHHLNLTNICEGQCKFCAYRKKEDEAGAFFIPLEQAVEHISANVNKCATEIHIVSAINPSCDLEYYKSSKSL